VQKGVGTPFPLNAPIVEEGLHKSELTRTKILS